LGHDHYSQRAGPHSSSLQELTPQSARGWMRGSWAPSHGLSTRFCSRVIEECRGDPIDGHCCGVETATSMVTTSLPRLTISRLSFGPMKQESLALSTVCFPPAISVSSPAST